MAQGAVTLLPGKDSSLLFSEQETHQIQEFTKIIKFRDAIISGTHPRIKLPAHLVTSKATNHLGPRVTESPGSSSIENIQNGTKSTSLVPNELASAATDATHLAGLSTVAGTQSQRLPGLGFLPAGTAPASSAAHSMSTPGKAEIDPILLQKSDGLIKAEIQLQRERIERAVKEQLEQRRNDRLLQPSDALPDFDLVDVLQRALVLVQTTTTASPNNADIAANKSDASDSFDDNTFYSSQFNSPDSAVHAGSDTGDVEMQDSSEYEPELDPATIPPPLEAGRAAPVLVNPPLPPTTSTLPANREAWRHGATAPTHAPIQVNSSGESGDVSRSGESGPTDNEHSADEVRLVHGNSGRDSPRIVHTHDLSLLAPQPSHVSALATSRHISHMAQELQHSTGTPAQVAALRRDGAVVSSPDSSPQGARGSEKKKNRKKKRKADRQTIDAEASPYIKPEPRSPSPIGTQPSYTRPHKRPKQSLRSAPDLLYDDSPRQPGNIVYQEHSPYLPRVLADERGPIIYEQVDDQFAPRRAQPAMVQGPSSQERSYYVERRPPSPQTLHHHHSPGAYPVEYMPREIRNVRSTSHAVLERPYADARVSYGEPRDPTRVSVRHAVDRDQSRSPIMRSTRTPLMAPPPRGQPVRIIVDEFGREYIEPPRTQASLLRHSVAPQSSPKELELAYQRVPPPVRATSRIPEALDDSDVIYRRASPANPPPRRVITQPEYGAGDYRAYRQREYSTRPPVTQEDDFVQIQSARRPLQEERPLEYVRAASVRPREPVRYEVARGYPERLGSVRPEAPVREYAATSQPELRREYATTMPGGARRDPYAPSMAQEYSLRPEQRIVQRSFSVRPAGPTYYSHPVDEEEEVTYITRPRAADPGMPYPDSSARRL